MRLIPQKWRDGEDQVLLRSIKAAITIPGKPKQTHEWVIEYPIPLRPALVVAADDTTSLPVTLEEQLQMTTPAGFATASSPPPPGSPSSFFSAGWLRTVFGIGAVLLSNAIDTIIFVLEEIHCFYTARRPPLSTVTEKSNKVFPRKRTVVAAPAAAEAADDFGGPAVKWKAKLEEDDEAGPWHQFASPLDDPFKAGEDARATTLAAAAPPVTVVVLGEDDPTNRGCGGEAGTGPPTSPSPSHQISGFAGAAEEGEEVAPRLHQLRQHSTLAAAAQPATTSTTVVQYKVRPATASELLLFVNGIAAVIYGVALCLSFISTVIFFAPASDDARQSGHLQRLSPPWLLTFFSCAVLASVSSLIGTLCLLQIVADYNSIVAVLVTGVRKTLTILFSYLLYHRPFTFLHGLGLCGVMGGAAWFEICRRRSQQHR